MLKRTKRKWLAAIALTGIATTMAAGGEKQPITIFAEPSARAFEQGEDVAIHLAITNSGHSEISFLTCSDLSYSIEIEDSRGAPVPKSTPLQPVEKDGEFILPLKDCGRNILVTLKPGKSWSETISLLQYIELKSPGSYTGRIILLPGKLSVDKVSSNSFEFTVRTRPQK
jgi:hypothetical protein